MKSLLPTKIISYKNQKTYSLQSMDQISGNDDYHRQIASICNQPEVYKLFGNRFEGKPYSAENAKDFLNWGFGGWREKSFFIFLVTNNKGEIVAAMDIKSNNKGSAEIGYWCSSDHHGITGRGVDTMSHWAGRNGFKELFAVPINERSMKLLQREGFLRDEAAGDVNGYGKWKRKL
ncbi:MAG: N-acetyltransferase [Proteobacteria bacterium]|nr:MAG: N-acetyltransferase [Pseudomonadota bacterium]